MLWPDDHRLDRLRRLWEKSQVTAAMADTSPTNLASIAVLAEFAGRKMLLTGDAHGDHIIAGLERAGVMTEGGSLDVDLLKVQHHGSARSADAAFFGRVRASATSSQLTAATATLIERPCKPSSTRGARPAT